MNYIAQMKVKHILFWKWPLLSLLSLFKRTIQALSLCSQLKHSWERQRGPRWPSLEYIFLLHLTTTLKETRRLFIFITSVTFQKKETIRLWRHIILYPRENIIVWIIIFLGDVKICSKIRFIKWFQKQVENVGRKIFDR